MKKITSIILIVLTALSLASCGAALDDEQTKEVAAPLIEASVNINEIFFGKGLAHEGNSSFDGYDPEHDDASRYDVTPVKYYTVTDERYQSIDDLKAAAREVYTDAYLENVFAVAFEGMTQDDGTIYKYPRYVSNVIGSLSVNAEAETEHTIANRTYDLSTLKVTGGASNVVYFTVQSYVDGVEDQLVRLSIKDEGRGWRLDSPTY